MFSISLIIPVAFPGIGSLHSVSKLRRINFQTGEAALFLVVIIGNEVFHLCTNFFFVQLNALFNTLIVSNFLSSKIHIVYVIQWYNGLSALNVDLRFELLEK